MFHLIKNVVPLENYILKISFVEGISKTYDVKPLIKKMKPFERLNNKKIFNKVHVGIGGYAAIFNDEIDIACDELFNNGKLIKTIFDDLISFSDATKIWSLSESTLRKAIQYKKLIDGVDARKFGNQWIVSTKAMKRLYGIPKF